MWGRVLEFYRMDGGGQRQISSPTNNAIFWVYNLHANNIIMVHKLGFMIYLRRLTDTDYVLLRYMTRTATNDIIDQ